MFKGDYPPEKPGQKDQPGRMADAGEAREGIALVDLPGDGEREEVGQKHRKALGREEEDQPADDLRDVQKPAPFADKAFLRPNGADHGKGVGDEVHGVFWLEVAREIKVSR